MIKPRNYAVLAEYGSASDKIETPVHSFFTFDTIDEAMEMQSELMKGRGGVFIVLKKNELINDEYDGVIEYLYDPMTSYCTEFRGTNPKLSDEDAFQIIQTFRELSNGEKVPEGEPVALIYDDWGDDTEFTPLETLFDLVKNNTP